MRNKIIEALKPLDKNIFYGAVSEKDFQNMKSADCIIVASDSIRLKESSSRDLVFTYNIFIVRENVVPEELILNVIEAMEQIPGLRLVNQSNPFEYLPKGKTGMIVETIMLSFSWTVKRCC